MRTLHKKKIICFVVLMFVVLWDSTKANEENENEGFVTYRGKVVNALNNEPVVFASVYKIGSNIGTISNSDGEFEIKVPLVLNNGEIGVSFIGYKAYAIDVNEIKDHYLVVLLEPSPVPIREVIIRNENPYELINIAKRKIPENYSMAPFMITAFYREIIMQNKNYVGVAEAVLDVYKASYINKFDYDRVKIYKGRKSTDVKRMDTILFKLKGGPKSSFLLDVVKNPAAIISDDFMDFYYYKYEGVIEVDNRQTYVISFDQKEDVSYSLYKGKIFLDASNLAISGIEFSLSEKGIENAEDDYIKKRPINMDVDIESADYLVNYREIDGKWYFNNIRTELRMNCKWNKKLFRSKYLTILEMVVTDMDFENVAKYRNRQTVGMSDVLIDQINYFGDTNFWGKYNTIMPDESIELAISKLNKKLIR